MCECDYCGGEGVSIYYLYHVKSQNCGYNFKVYNRRSQTGGQDVCDQSVES